MKARMIAIPRPRCDWATARSGFHEPVSVGDIVSCYARVDRVGRTSIRVAIETYVRRRDGGHTEKVTEGTFTFVAVDKQGQKRVIDAQ